MLLAFLTSNVGAHTVVYSLSGDLLAPEWPNELPCPQDGAFTSTFAFDGHSAPIAHDDETWFWHRPASWMRIEFDQHHWTNSNPLTCGEVDMKWGYAGISWRCSLVNEVGEAARVYMDLQDFSAIPSDFQSPYPMGPFTPENFRDFDLWAFVMFRTANYETLGSVKLDDVRFVNEPGTLALSCAVAVAVLAFRRSSRDSP